MRSVVIKRVARSLGMSVCLSSTIVSSEKKTAEPIEMPFGMLTWVGSRKHVLDGGAHWHHLANTIEASM